MGDKSKLKLGVYQNPRGDRSKESIKRYTDGFRKKNTRTTITDRGTVRKINLLTGGQAKIAAKAPPPNKIDEKDFAVLRAEKAKGRGMGLQDEKVKPGKVMKANLGLMFMKKAKDKGAKGAEFLSPLAMLKRLSGRKAGGVMKARVGKSIKTGRISDMSFDEKMKRVESGQINKKTGRFTSMNAMRDAKGFQKGETASDFNKRRMKLERAAKVAKSTRLGKILLPVVGAAVAAKTYLNSKMKKDKNKKTLKDFREQKKPGVPSEKTKTINSALNKLKAKKMGGGMMQKPIGYKSGMGPGGAAGSMAGRPGGRRPMQQGPKGGIGSLSKNRSNDDLVILVNSGDGKVIKMKRSDFKNNMSPPKKKMGGGMMQKPMGYSTGGPSAGYKSKEDRKKAEKNIKEARSKEGLRSFLSSGNKINQPMRKERYMEGRKARHSAFKKKLGRTAARIASSLNPVTTAASVIGKVIGKGSKKRDFQKGDYGDISVKKMGGGMMQKPMGYRSGTMVKARGCKLGRTKPTKIT